MRRILLVLIGLVIVVAIWWAWPAVSFDDSLPAEVETRNVITDGGEQITLVRPLVNGRDLGWFALDSGASNTIIDARHADALGLPAFFRASVTGCDIPVTMRRAARFQLGRLIMKGPVLVAIDFEHLPDLLEAIDIEIAGIVGYPVFASAVVEIEYARAGEPDRVSIHRPSDYRLPGGAWRPLRIVGTEALLPARLPGSDSEWFMLDTGKSGSMSFYADYVSRHGLLNGRSAVRRPNVTVCGKTEELEGELEWFELAGRRFDRPLVRFKLPGTFNERGVAAAAGTIGREFLRRFDVVFDYPRQRIALLSH